MWKTNAARALGDRRGTRLDGTPERRMYERRAGLYPCRCNGTRKGRRMTTRVRPLVRARRSGRPALGPAAQREWELRAPWNLKPGILGFAVLVGMPDSEAMKPRQQAPNVMVDVTVPELSAREQKGARALRKTAQPGHVKKCSGQGRRRPPPLVAFIYEPSHQATGLSIGSCTPIGRAASGITGLSGKHARTKAADHG